MIIQRLFQNFLNFVLALSKMIDVHPAKQMQVEFNKVSKQVGRSWVICQLLNPHKDLTPADQ